MKQLHIKPGCAAVVVTFMTMASLFAADDFEILDFKVDPSLRVPTAPLAAREAWKDNRFGMFIHWGPISQLGQPLSHSRNSSSHRTGGKPYKTAAISPEVYDAQYKTFNPTNYNPDAIAKLAKAAGARYIVFTESPNSPLADGGVRCDENRQGWVCRECSETGPRKICHDC